jgi:integrase
MLTYDFLTVKMAYSSETGRCSVGKSGNGEGSIYQRSERGDWVGAITVDRTRKVVYAATRRDVAEKLRLLRNAIADGQPLAAGGSLAAFVPDWLAACRVAGKRSRTLRGYERLMRLHVTPTLGKVLLTKLTPEHLERLYAAKLETLSETTVHHIHAVVHRALAHALRKDLIARNVASLVDAPAIKTREMVTLSEDELQRFIAQVAGDELEALHVTAVTTGMRLSELLGLRWRDVDLTKREIHLRYTLEKYHGEITFAEPKTKGSRRTVNLVRTAAELLRRHRVAQARARITAGAAWIDRDLVFTNELGLPVADQSFRRGFHRHLKAADCPEIRIHDGRHTAASILLGRGVHAKIVSEMLGHSRIATTMDLYSHVTPTMQREATAEMEKAIGGQA